MLHLTYLFDLPKAIIVPELSLLFVPTPKVANRSMKHAIATRLDPNFRGDPHLGWRYVPLPLARDNEYFRFGFVRNPLDRLVSCYSQKIVHYGRERGMPLEFWRYGRRFQPGMSFEDFVRTVASIPDAFSDIHFRSQHKFFFHRGRLMVDFVGRYEHLAEDWSKLSSRFGFLELPHHNRSVRGDYRKFYTPDLAAIAAQRYRRDIEVFGYESEVAALITRDSTMQTRSKG